MGGYGGLPPPGIPAGGHNRRGERLAGFGLQPGHNMRQPVVRRFVADVLEAFLEAIQKNLGTRITHQLLESFTLTGQPKK